MAYRRRRTRTFFLTGVCLLLMLGLAGTVLSYVVTARTPVAESAPPRLIPNTDVNPYGANFFLDREVELWKREKTVQMAKEAGIGWARQQFPWEAIEPKRKGQFVDERGQSTWRKFDEIVALYEKYGLQIIARLDRPPDWTRKDNTLKERPPDDFNDFGGFVYEFVRHYKGRIHYIQIWNEPNVWPEWGNQQVNPAAYVELLKIAYRRAKEVDPNIFVLSAPLAINTENFPIRRNLSDLIFLEEMYQAGARDYFDILSANAFGMDLPPDAPPDPDTLNFQRVLLQRQIMEKYGDQNKPVWFSEYGWNAAPAEFPKEQQIWKRVSEADQARFTIEGIERARREWPWAGVFSIWYFRQVGDVPPTRADYYFRLVDPDFTVRRVYQAVKAATTGLGIAGPGYYQETHPAIHANADWRTIIAPSSSGGMHLESAVPGASLTFTFEGNEVDLVTRQAPDAGRLWVTLDDHPVSYLPRDRAGRPYIDLYRPAPRDQARLPLIRNAGSGRHTLRLAVADSHHPDATGWTAIVDGFIVTADEGRAFPGEVVIGLSLGLVVIGGLLVKELRGTQRNSGELGGTARNPPEFP